MGVQIDSRLTLNRSVDLAKPARRQAAGFQAIRANIPAQKTAPVLLMDAVPDELGHPEIVIEGSRSASC